MTVVEFIEMFVDETSQYFELWDINNGGIVFKGYLYDLYCTEFEYATVTSIDNICKGGKGITLNIEIE